MGMELSNQKCSLAHPSVGCLQNSLLYRNLPVYQCSIAPTHIHCHIIRLRRIKISRFYLSNVSNIRNYFKLFLFIFVILAPVQNWSVHRSHEIQIGTNVPRTTDGYLEPVKSIIFFHFHALSRTQLNQRSSHWQFQIIKSKQRKECYFTDIYVSKRYKIVYLAQKCPLWPIGYGPSPRLWQPQYGQILIGEFQRGIFISC